MNWKSFIIGFVSGIVVSFIVLFCIGLGMQNSGESAPIQYFERSVSYEDKPVAAFEVFQVLGNAALAREVSADDSYIFDGKTVLILGENYYNDQTIRVQNPKIIGTYSYTTNSGSSMTVPVISAK